MTITRPRKARILEKAGLRYVAGWLRQLQRSAKGGSINSFRATNYIAMRNAER